MEHHFTNSATRRALRAATLLLALVLGSPGWAADTDLDRFRARIDALVDRLGRSTNGVVKWAGSDLYEIRRDGDAFIAVITNGRFAIGMPPSGTLTFDRVEIRQVGQKENGELIELAWRLPTELTISGKDSATLKISLKEATATALTEAQSGRDRETAVTVASARLDQLDSGTWAAAGPLMMTSKLVAEPSGAWSALVDLAVSDIECFGPQVPVEVGIKRITFSGRSAGPRLEALNRWRDAIEALPADDGRSPETRRAAFFTMLSSVSTPFSGINGNIAVDGVTVRSATAEALVSLANLEVTTTITGLDSEAAAIRFAISQKGLDLAPSILEAGRVPRDATFDLGVSDLNIQALGKLVRAAGAMVDESETVASETQPSRQQALGQLLGAAAMINPIFHIYGIAIDTKDVGFDLTGEAKGSPLTPGGYSAAGDLAIRGFDAIPNLGIRLPFADYLPVLREIGIKRAASDGTERVDFNLLSVPPKWLAINGNDVATWFDGHETKPGEPRLLRPSDPAMQGNDVRSVQRALTKANIPIDQDGIYSPTTAAAVAQFQKQNGLNVSGVVDNATRQRLRLPADTPRPGGRN